MKYVGTAAACGLLASSSLVHAIEGNCRNPFSCGTWSGNIGFASEYVWQGISQSAGKPTVNGGFDWDSGTDWYLSMWGSNVRYYDSREAKFVSNSLNGGRSGHLGSNIKTITSDDNAYIELDFYVGYWGYIGGGYNTPYDIGLGYYAYPGARTKDIHYSGNVPILYKDGRTHDAQYVAWGTGNYFNPYVGIGHYFLDDRWKTFAYLSYTNDYNGQNQDEWELYDDNEFYLPYGVTFRLHAGYNWGQYWQKNLFGWTGADMKTGISWGWCGYTYAKGIMYPGKKATINNPKIQQARYKDCVAGAGKDNDFFDWGIGLSKSFGQFDFTLDYVWVTGLNHTDEAKSWWAGMDQTGPNQIYTNGKLVAAVKMAI